MVQQVLIIAVKEFTTAFKDKIFLVMAILFLLLSSVSVYIGSATQHAELSAYADIVKLLKVQGAASFPPKPEFYPLAILRNIIDYVGMAGAILAIFLGFAAFSGEKEQGTMKLILSRPLFRDQLLSGKLLGGVLVISFLLTIILLFNMLLFTLVSGVVPSIAELGRLSFFMLLSLCYMMSFYIATVLVSIKSKDSAFVFLAMLVLWVGVSFVIPQLADSQKTFAYALNAGTQTLAQVPADTAVSKIIQMFSPTVQFQNLGRDLLQTTAETASAGLGEILFRRFWDLTCMLVPGFLVLLASYITFLKGGE